MKEYLSDPTALVAKPRALHFMRLLTLLLAILFALNIGAALCLAQDDGPRYKIPLGGLRVHGGFVNFVEGEAEQSRAGESRPLKPRQALANGDLVNIGHAGRTEILLTPGYYLRLGSDTRVAFLDLSPGNLKIKILNGSAIVEMSINDINLLNRHSIYDLVTICTPRDEYALTTGGAYRFNVRADGASDVKVLKGLATVSGASLKNGAFASVLSGRVDVGSAEKKPEDGFDEWSRQRAASLIQANRSLKHAKWFRQLQDGRADATVEEAQDTRAATEAHTISARSGFVRLAEDGALVKRAAAWEKLRSGDSLKSGDRVRTPLDCRVDVRPRPDVALLISGDTELVYNETDGGDLSIEVTKGEAIIVPRFLAAQAAQSAITLVVSRTPFVISRSGVYRVNVFSAAAAQLLVYEGEGRLSDRHLKAAKKISFAESGSTVVDFNKSAQDSFDAWAEKRSQSLLVAERRDHREEWGGVWFVIEATGEFTFVPAAFAYESPYGGDYAVKYITHVTRPTDAPKRALTDEFPPVPTAPRNPSTPAGGPAPPTPSRPPQR